MDTLVSALLVSERRDTTPVQRLVRATERIEQLMGGLGFVETAKTLREFREQASTEESPMPRPLVIAPEITDDPLTGRPSRKRKAVS